MAKPSRGQLTILSSSASTHLQNPAQIRIERAGHYFDNLEEELVEVNYGLTGYRMAPKNRA